MKKNYIKPNSLLIQMNAAPMMAAVSGKLNDTPWDGVAGAKGNVFFAFEEEALPEDPTKIKEEEDWDDEEEDL